MSFTRVGLDRPKYILKEHINVKTGQCVEPDIGIGKRSNIQSNSTIFEMMLPLSSSSYTEFGLSSKSLLDQSNKKKEKGQTVTKLVTNVFRAFTKKLPSIKLPPSQSKEEIEENFYA